jgi:hypothetical protein
MQEVYPKSRAFTKTQNFLRHDDHEEHAPASPGPRAFSRQIEAVKDGARIEVVAADYGEFKLAGPGRLLGRCVSPRHEDRTPSMTIYPAEQRFKCFGIGCGARGDVIDLVKLAEDCETWEAMVRLATRYGIDAPGLAYGKRGRPESWHARNARQKPIRNGIDRARREHLSRRLFRLYFKDAVMAIEDLEEREAEYRILLEASERLARMMIDELEARRSAS